MCPNRSALHDSGERVNAQEPDRRFRHLASHETADKLSTRSRTVLAGRARQHLNIRSRRCQRASTGHHCMAAPFSARAKQSLQSAPTLYPRVRVAFLCGLPVRHGANSTRSDFFVRSLGFGLDLGFSVSNMAVMRQRYRVALSDSSLDQSCLQQSMPFKSIVNGLLNFADLFLRLGL